MCNRPANCCNCHSGAGRLRWCLRVGALCACFVIAQRLWAAEFELRVTVSQAEDRGQNWGSLFEIVDAEGQPNAGAGYLGAYNTFPRSDREELQIFVRAKNPQADWQIERLPQIDGAATGYYPFQMAGEVYTAPRGGSDSRVRRWNDAANTWEVVDGVPNGCEQIAGRPFHLASDRITWNGETLLTPDAPYRFGEHYFAEGRLVVRAFRSDGGEPANTFQVFAWNPAAGERPQPLGALTLNLPQPREFVYAFGQWQDHILAVTNMGGVYRLRPAGWDTLRTPIPTVSYQVYCCMNYYDRLLLGHYPTGEFFEYAGDDLVLKKGWPPVMPGVSTSAREAQTVTIYNGELYAGVWPWAEVWRYDGAAWHFVQRMFSHPTVADAVTHPYETETQAVDAVLNLWGQRVTGLIPSHGALFITTSSKSGGPWEPKFGFLSVEQQRDYGAVYCARLPGQFTVHTPLAAGPTRIELHATGESLRVTVNGSEAGQIAVSPAMLKRLATGTVQWGSGVYGRCRLNIEEKQYEVLK